MLETPACGGDGALVHFVGEAGERLMMSERTVMQKALFYSFSLEQHIPADHMLRSIDRFVERSRSPPRLSRQLSDLDANCQKVLQFRREAES